MKPCSFNHDLYHVHSNSYSEVFKRIKIIHIYIYQPTNRLKPFSLKLGYCYLLKMIIICVIYSYKISSLNVYSVRFMKIAVLLFPCFIFINEASQNDLNHVHTYAFSSPEIIIMDSLAKLYKSFLVLFYGLILK